MFLTGIFFLLLFLVFLFSLLSKMFVFERLEPAFVGALVGAAGTIFAACIAYSVASQNLAAATKTAEDNAKQRIENEETMKRLRRENAVTELQQVRAALAYLDKVLDQFSGAAEAGDRDYVAFMLDVDRAGGIVQFLGSAPMGVYPKVQEVFMRFQNIRGSINMLQNGRPAADVANERAALNRSLRDRVLEVRKVRGEMDEEVRRRERLIDAANSKLQ